MHNAFKVHMLNQTGKQKAQEMAEAFDDLATKLSALCPASRELSLAMTKLEEACFFAKKAMASDAINTAPPGPPDPPIVPGPKPVA